MRKRSNRWIIEAKGNQYDKHVIGVRISPALRTPEEVAEPDGTVTPLPGLRFGLCYIEVQTLSEKHAYDFFRWYQEKYQQHDTLACYMIEHTGMILQTYEFEMVLPIGIAPDPGRRYQKNTFHGDTLRFVGNLTGVNPS